MRLIVGFVAIFLSVAAANHRPGTAVTFRAVDQLGQAIEASQFVVDPGSILVPQDGTIELDPGSYSVRVFPGVLGAVQGSLVFRDEPIVVGTGDETFEFTWEMADMQVTISDQFGSPATGSQVFFVGRDWAAGTVVHLPVTEDPSRPAVDGEFANGYGVRGFPGMLGYVQGFVLYRDYPPEELTSAGLNLNYEWPHADLLFRVVDQHGVEYTNGQASFLNTVLGDYPTGVPLYLPVTDDPTPPSIGGAASNGFDLRSFPSILDTAQGSIVYRDYLGIELVPDGTTIDLVHPSADLQVNVVDQDGLPITNSLINLLLALPGTEFITGTTVTMPVTEVTSGPPVYGGAEFGYELRAFPGLNGLEQGSVLYRDEPRVELGDSGLVRNVVWEVAKGPLRVVDFRGNEVPNSATLMDFYGVIRTGTHVEIPINDNVLYPTLGGSFLGGYPMTIRLKSFGRLSAVPRRAFDFGPFPFEILTGSVFSPSFVTIRGASYGLRFHPQLLVDLDRDGYPAPLDRDDTDPAVYPGAPDLPGDLVDQDGDGVLSCDPRGPWKSPAEFLGAVSREAESLRAAGRISDAQRDTVLISAAGIAVHRL